MIIRAENLRWAVPEREIVKGISIEFSDNKLTAIIGPNGSGKTSLLHLVAGLRKPTGGRVWLGDELLTEISTKKRARTVALVEQLPNTELDLTVQQVVELGRIPYRGSFPGAKDKDPDAVPEAMEKAGVKDLATRSWRTLSGGERQRVQLARALAQRPKILLLDEPTNHLDLSHQLEFLQMVSELPFTVIAVLHDLDLAAAFCAELVVMKDGKIASAGNIDILTSEIIKDVYQVEAKVTNTDRRRVTWFKPKR